MMMTMMMIMMISLPLLWLVMREDKLLKLKGQQMSLDVVEVLVNIRHKD